MWTLIMTLAFMQNGQMVEEKTPIKSFLSFQECFIEMGREIDVSHINSNVKATVSCRKKM